MEGLKDNLKYAHRFAKRDDIYDHDYVEGILKIEDASEMKVALKYTHRFAKRESTYDAQFIEEFINSL